MYLTLPILERSRKYGYIYWLKRNDTEVEQFFGTNNRVKVWLQDSFLGSKIIDSKYRRISVGTVIMKEVPRDLKKFHLTWKKDGILKVVCI